MKFSVIGGEGFIGRNLRLALQRSGAEVAVFRRDRVPKGGDELGHVIYAAGVTGDFRSRIDDLLECHVVELRRVLTKCTFTSLLFLSSTRLYGTKGASNTALEDDPVAVLPSDESIYDLSKLLGEALCLSDPRHEVRVARLSNVYGVGQRETNFLGSLLRDLVKDAKVEVQESEQSSKDYVSVSDVAEILPRIAVKGHWRLYNVASGTPLKHSDLGRLIERRTGRQLVFAPGAKTRISPTIDVSRLIQEFGFAPRSLATDVDDLLMGSGIAPLDRSPTARNL